MTTKAARKATDYNTLHVRKYLKFHSCLIEGHDCFYTEKCVETFSLIVWQPTFAEGRKMIVKYTNLPRGLLYI